MDCLKGKKEAKAKPGNFTCKKCGAVSEDTDRFCKPKEIKE